MLNKSAENLLKECESELKQIEQIVTASVLNKTNAFLINYSIIRASGALEQAFKNIVGDSLDFSSLEKIKDYVEKKIRQASTNPKYSSICSVVGDVKPEWKEMFVEEVKKLNNGVQPKYTEELDRLITLRHGVAHGKPPAEVSIQSVVSAFNKGKRVIELLDSTVVDFDYILISTLNDDATEHEIINLIKDKNLQDIYEILYTTHRYINNNNLLFIQVLLNRQDFFSQSKLEQKNYLFLFLEMLSYLDINDVEHFLQNLQIDLTHIDFKTKLWELFFIKFVKLSY
ncbi:MAG: HEPN domain-containing protein [Planococcus donghaensis]